MRWKVSTKDESYSYTAVELLNIFVSKTNKELPEDQLNIVTTLEKWLEKQPKILQVSPIQLVTLGFNIGYIYKTFLEKNTVEIED